MVLRIAVFSEYNRPFRTVKNFFKGDGNLVGHVLAFFRGLVTSAAAAAGVGLIEKRGVRIASPHIGGPEVSGLSRCAKTELAQDIIEVEAPEDILLGITLVKIRRTIQIVLLFFIRIGQYGIGFIDFFELGFGFLATVVFVRVIFKRKFSVRFFNLRRGRILFYSQDFIVIHGNDPANNDLIKKT